MFGEYNLETSNLNTEVKTVLTYDAKEITSVDALKNSLAESYKVKTTDIYVFILDDGTVIVVIVQY